MTSGRFSSLAISVREWTDRPFPIVRCARGSFGAIGADIFSHRTMPDGSLQLRCVYSKPRIRAVGNPRSEDPALRMLNKILRGEVKGL